MKEHYEKNLCYSNLVFLCVMNKTVVWSPKTHEILMFVMFSHGVFNWGRVMLRPEGKYVCCICSWKLSAGEGNGWHSSVPESRVFIQCFTNSPLQRKNYYDFNKHWGVEKVRHWSDSQREGPDPFSSSTIPRLLLLLLHSTRNVLHTEEQAQPENCFLPGSVPCARSAEIYERHFSAPCSFILATFHQPLPILHNIHSCGMSGLNEVHNSSSQLEKTSSCIRTAFALFVLNEKQGLLQIKHPVFLSLLHNDSQQFLLVLY